MFFEYQIVWRSETWTAVRITPVQETCPEPTAGFGEEKGCA
jgi:hypothetical protein